MQQYLRQRQQKLKKSQRRTNNLEKIISEQLNDSKKGMVTKMTIPFCTKKYENLLRSSFLFQFVSAAEPKIQPESGVLQYGDKEDILQLILAGHTKYSCNM